MIPRSVTSRLVFFYCLLLVALGGTFLFFTVLSFETYTRQAITDNLAARTDEVWNLSQGLLDQPDKLAPLITRRFAPEVQERFIRIRQGETVLYRSGDPASHDFHAADVPLSASPLHPRASLHGNLLLYTRSFTNEDGTYVIDSGQSFVFARTVQRRLATSLAIGLPILLLAAAIAGYILMRRALTPVEVMINAAESYTFHDPHNRLPLVGAEPRIEALGLALNRMLDRLDQAYTHVNRFSADAAHELRTPLTIIRGELELATNQPRPRAEIERAISNALEEMTRLSGIVDSLLTLSRMGSSWGKHAHASVDLSELARETIEQISLLAEEKQIAISVTPAPPVMVAGDRDRLKQVMVNLIDNAIKYTPAGGSVTVQTGAGGDTAFVAVEDTGIGMGPEQQDRIFDRFYRVSTDRGEEGAGLGLAIVKAICQAHGGSISVRSAPKRGSCFRVELPLQAAPLAGAPDALENRIAAAGAAAATQVQN